MADDPNMEQARLFLALLHDQIAAVTVAIETNDRRQRRTEVHRCCDALRTRFPTIEDSLRTDVSA